MDELGRICEECSFEFGLKARLDFEMCGEDIVREQGNDSKWWLP